MDPLRAKYSPWKRMVHRFQARRDVPFRKRFFMGYDLHGNTYWEFSPDGNLQRLRRKMEPYQEFMFKADYFSTVPPQWLQWLRRTRNDPPTVQDLLDDQARQRDIAILAQHVDHKWAVEKQRQQEVEAVQLQRELASVERKRDQAQPEASPSQSEPSHSEASPSQSQPESSSQADPWAQADRSASENPIESATFTPRR